MKFHGDIEEAIKSLNYVRQYKPYKYGGKWYLAKIGQWVWAFRTKQPLLKRAKAIGLETLEITELGNKRCR